MTWNVENLKRNIFNLQHFLDQFSPDFCFLSEPQMFSFDLKRYMTHIGDHYCAELNSDDKEDQDLPLFNNRSHGGTMAIWKKSLDKYISIHQVSSSSFLPLVYSPPCSPVSVHIGLYLPTSGKESQFVTEMSKLQILLDELNEKYPSCIIFLRGDCNANPKNRDRSIIFNNFISDLNLVKVPIPHATYHHFIGDGLFDSNIDTILYSNNSNVIETVDEIICKFENCYVESHHDIILSSAALPVCPPPFTNDDLKVAPKVEINRVKVKWNDDNLAEYQAIVEARLLSHHSHSFSSFPTRFC